MTANFKRIPHLWGNKWKKGNNFFIFIFVPFPFPFIVIMDAAVVMTWRLYTHDWLWHTFLAVLLLGVHITLQCSYTMGPSPRLTFLYLGCLLKVTVLKDTQVMILVISGCHCRAFTHFQASELTHFLGYGVQFFCGVAHCTLLLQWSHPSAVVQ